MERTRSRGISGTAAGRVCLECENAPNNDPGLGKFNSLTFLYFLIPAKVTIGADRDPVRKLVCAEKSLCWRNSARGHDSKSFHIHDLLISFPSEPMRMWPVSTRVNKPENDDEHLLDEVKLATA